MRTWAPRTVRASLSPALRLLRRTLLLLLAGAVAAGCALAEDPPIRKLSFFRSHLLTFDELKIDVTSGSKRANLFVTDSDDETDAQWYRKNAYRGDERGKDYKVYRWTEDQLMETPEGRAFVERVRAELRASPQAKEAAFLFPDTPEGAEAYQRCLLSKAEEIAFVPRAEDEHFNVPVGRPVSKPREQQTEEQRAQQPKPVPPSFQEQVEARLKSIKVAELSRQRDNSDFSFFENDLFWVGGGPQNIEGAGDVARAWKKVLSSKRFLRRSSLLAEMRWALLVDIFSEVASTHGVRIDLIDSGKRNAYSSDVDLTVYSPPLGRPGLSMKQLIASARQRFIARFHYPPEALDITIHDGDVFLPGVRNEGQSVQSYTETLRSLVFELKLKVDSGGDASYFPGANLDDVQKRTFREGRVTVLQPGPEVVSKADDGSPIETRFQKPVPKEIPASEFGSRGEVVPRTELLVGDLPMYDHANALGNLSQALEKMYRNGNDHGAVAKLFNRGMAQGAGAGLVNSFYDIHVSNLSEAGVTAEEAAELALLAEADPGDASINEPRLWERLRSKNVAKIRWIVRALGIRPEPSMKQKLLDLFDVLNTTSEMEVEKNAKRFNWKEGRARYLKRYLERAKRVYRLTDSPADQDKLYDAAWREFCDAMMEVMQVAMVRALRDALADLTPERMRWNAARRGAHKGENDYDAARKYAERLRVELRLLFELLNRAPRLELQRTSDPTAAAAQARDAAEAWKEQLEILKEALLASVPEEDQVIRDYLKRLSEIDAVRLELFFKGEGSETPVQEQLAKLEAAVERVTAGLPKNPARISDEDLRKAIEIRTLLDNPVPEGPMIQRFFDGMSTILRTSITSDTPPIDPKTGKPRIDPKTGRPMESRAGGALVHEVFHNLINPLMLSSSGVDLARAYVHGGERAVREAAFSTGMLYLGPVYGVVGIMFQDFSRGRISEGVHSLVFLGGLHIVSKFIPAAGPALLVYNIATGTVDIVYTYTSETITEDMVEQALRSRRVAGDRAQRNPYRDSTDFFRGDRPEFPLLWDNACVETQPWNRDSGHDLAAADFNFAPGIWKELTARGLTPNSKDWEAQRNRLVSKEAFDLPFYERMERLYGCFHDEVWSTVQKGFDEDNVLKHVFTREVNSWLSKQPEGYQREFDSIFDVNEKAGQTHRRMVGQLAQILIHYYKQGEDKKNKIEWRERDLREGMMKASREIQERVTKAEKLRLAAREEALDKLQERIAQLALASAAAGPETPRVRLQAPNWYVNMTAVLGPEGYERRTAAEEAAVIPDEESATQEDEGAIPVHLTAASEPGRHGGFENWNQRITLKLDSITRGRPEGFVPNARESQLLAAPAPGQPAHDIYTVRLTASATVHDPQGRLLGQAPPVPIVGYVIAQVPKFSGRILIRAGHMGRAPDGSPLYQPVLPHEVTLAGQTVRVTEEKYVEFKDLPATDYTVHAKALVPGFEGGQASFRLVDPYSKEALRSGSHASNPSEIFVELTPLPQPAKPAGKSDKPAEPAAALTPPPRPAPALDPKHQQNCESLISGAQQALAGGDLSSSAAALKQGQDKKCEDVPGLSAEVEGLRRQLESSVNAAVQRIQQSASPEVCNFAEAWQRAQELQRLDPQNPALKTINMEQLQMAAAAQDAVRGLQQQAQEALDRNNPDAAAALLQQALGLRGLPDCMRDPLAQKLAQLRRSQFGSLAQQVQDSIDACDYDRAVQTVGRITNLRPRDEAVTAWLNVNVPRLFELQTRRKEALAALALAEKLFQQANNAISAQPPDWAAANSLLRQADSALNEADAKAPGCLPQRARIQKLKQEVGQTEIAGLSRGTPTNSLPPSLQGTAEHSGKLPESLLPSAPGTGTTSAHPTSISTSMQPQSSLPPSLTSENKPPEPARPSSSTNTAKGSEPKPPGTQTSAGQWGQVLGGILGGILSGRTGQTAQTQPQAPPAQAPPPASIPGSSSTRTQPAPTAGGPARTVAVPAGACPAIPQWERPGEELCGAFESSYSLIRASDRGDIVEYDSIWYLKFSISGQCRVHTVPCHYRGNLTDRRRIYEHCKAYEEGLDANLSIKRRPDGCLSITWSPQNPSQGMQNGQPVVLWGTGVFNRYEFPKWDPANRFTLRLQTSTGQSLPIILQPLTWDNVHRTPPLP